MKRRFQTFFRDTSIRNKFILITCAVLLLSFSFLSAASYFTLQRGSMRRAREENAAVAQRTAEGIGQLFEYGISISRLVSANAWVQEYYGSPSPKDAREQRALVRSFLNTIAKPHGTFHAMILYDASGQSVSSSSAIPPIPITEASFIRVWNTLSEQWGASIYECRESDHAWQISLMKPVMNAQTGSIIAVLEIIYDQDQLMNLLSTSGTSMRMAILDDSGTALVQSDEEMVLPEREAVQSYLPTSPENPLRFRAGKSWLNAFSAPIADCGWFVLTTVPDSDINRQAHQQLRIIFCIIILALLMCVLGALLLSDSLTRPLRVLERCMERVGHGDLNAKSKLSGKDEIGRMSNQFNAMLDQISSLIDQVSNERLAKQESQLLALQAQINPHFLYNTLSSITALISLGMQDDALWMTHALEIFYKTSLSGGENIITLEKELQNVTNYLDILRYRYDGIFDYCLNCEACLRQYLITKLTLQPLVENAVHHGLRKQLSHGQLNINARLEGNTLLISVEDNGPGIPCDVANHFRDRITNSYGLYNVDARIKLYFGQAYGLSIDTNRTVGACVTIRLPAVKSREEIETRQKETRAK